MSFRPTLQFTPVDETPNTMYKMTVIPSGLFGRKTKEKVVTELEVARIRMWQHGHMLIQEALPDWDAADRELLLTGMDNEEFHKYVGTEEDEDDR